MRSADGSRELYAGAPLPHFYVVTLTTALLGLVALLMVVAALRVDDLRASGWTLTEVAALLRDAGSGPVYPFVLAVS